MKKQLLINKNENGFKREKRAPAFNNSVAAYLSIIGRKGGLKSRRKLDPQTAQNMVRIREARRAFKKYHAQCFWSYDPGYTIQQNDITWVGQQLMKNGNRKLWMIGAKLCR